MTCIHAFLQDYGYSNYSCEGTNLLCVNHPKKRFDSFYGEAEEHKFAEICRDYFKGKPKHQDVDSQYFGNKYLTE